METSEFLAKILGAYIVIVTAGVLINWRRYLKTTREFKTNAHVSLAFGFFAIIVGLVVVTLHNIWTSDWRVLVTIFGWLILGKGATYMIFPGWLTKIAVKFNKPLVFSLIPPFLILGLYLFLKGF